MWENPEVLALKDLIEKKFKVIKLIFVLGVSTQALSILYPSVPAPFRTRLICSGTMGSSYLSQSLTT